MGMSKIKKTHRIKPNILKIKTIATTKHFNIERLELKFSNNARRTYERLKGSNEGAVLIVPLLNSDTVLLTYEYSCGTNKYELAFPKGKIDLGESPFEAANRELKEEIGYGSEKLTHLKTVTLAPGYQSNFTHIILAEKLYPKREIGDEPEPLEVVERKLSNLEYWINDDDLSEGRSITALYLTRTFLSSH